MLFHTNHQLIVLTPSKTSTKFSLMAMVMTGLNAELVNVEISTLRTEFLEIKLCLLFFACQHEMSER